MLHPDLSCMRFNGYTLKLLCTSSHKTEKLITFYPSEYPFFKRKFRKLLMLYLTKPKSSNQLQHTDIGCTKPIVKKVYNILHKDWFFLWKQTCVSVTINTVSFNLVMGNLITCNHKHPIHRMYS